MITRITHKKVKEIADVTGAEMIFFGYGEVSDFETMWSVCFDSNYYTCGVYGWNYDVYFLSNELGLPYIVTTGYRNMPGNRGTREQKEEITMRMKNYYNNYMKLTQTWRA